MQNIFKPALAALIGLNLIVGVVTVADASRYKGYEMPPFEVEATDGAVEIRRYAPHVLAEVTVDGDRSSAINRGFRVLASYIFGGNAPEEKIAMTVPVAQTQDAARWTVSFMMPASFSKDALPTPDNEAIRFVETTPERQLVIQFAGLGSTRSLQTKERELRAYAAASDLEITGAPRYYFYDDPFTLPWKRRNEVAFVLR